MALQLLTGGSGSGKTRALYHKIIEMSLENPEGQYFIIVPEQATMQAQKELIQLHPRHGTMNIDVLSFKRLAYRVFSELSIPQPQVLDDTGKVMVLRKLAGERKKDLILFSSHLNQPGFLNEVKSMLSEFCQYGVTPSMLKNETEKGGISRVLSGKLQDMCTLFEAFREYTRERYLTAEELLDALCREVPRSRLLKDSVIALDGYTGFTPVQYRLIALLLGVCRTMMVTVTFPEQEDMFREGRESDLFDMSRKMAGKLRAVCREQGIEMEPEICVSKRPLPRFSESPALDYLERTVFRYPYRPYAGRTDSVIFVRGENPAGEIEFAANEIERLVREEGYRYRDVAVVSGDPDRYSREILRQFRENGIPVFLDETRDVTGNPLIRLMKSSLAMLQKGFDYESMFQYLRTGLVSGETERIDRMENYVRALGIRGFRRWDSPWEKTYEGGEYLNLEEMNRFREEIMEPLRKWKERAGKASTAGDMTSALEELLKQLDTEEKLRKLSADFENSGNHEAAGEYGQIHALVMELFEQFHALLGEEAISLKEYAAILSAGLSELRVGLIPACVDRVVAGDLKRTRLDQIRALFFVGVNEGIVPAVSERGGILTDQEREMLKSRSMELAPTAREEGFMQRFYLYLAMTRPGERLYLSWSGLSADGKTLRPSSVVNQLRKRFPDQPVLEAEAVREPAVNRTAAEKTVIRALQNPGSIPRDQIFQDLYRWLSGKGQETEKMERLAEAVSYSYEDHGIGKAAAKELYGQILNGSVTRMEQYAACAYAHFLSYGLELKKRREYEIDLSDMGNLFHQSLDLFFRTVRERGKDFRCLEDGERKELVRSCVEQVSGRYRNTILKSTARNAYLEKKVEKITDRTIRALIYQIRKGDFEPAAFEMEVNRRIPLDGESALNLRGRIDRMDICEDGDRVYVKIMDYKSGSTSFDLALLYHGLQMQLVVYLDAAMEMEKKKHPDKETVPAGIFYYHIDDPVVEKQEGLTDQEIEAEILRKLRMNGLVNSTLEVIRRMDREIETESDVIPVALKNGLLQEARSSAAGGERFAHLTEFVRDRLAGMGREILDGTISVNPYKQGSRTACDYCPYHSVCGFDLKTGGYGFRRFRPMKAEEIWEKIEGTEDTDDEGETPEKEEDTAGGEDMKARNEKEKPGENSAQEEGAGRKPDGKGGRTHG